MGLGDRGVGQATPKLGVGIPLWGEGSPVWSTQRVPLWAEAPRRGAPRGSHCEAPRGSRRGAGDLYVGLGDLAMGQETPKWGSHVARVKVQRALGVRVGGRGFCFA